MRDSKPQCELLLFLLFPLKQSYFQGYKGCRGRMFGFCYRRSYHYLPCCSWLLLLGTPH